MIEDEDYRSIKGDMLEARNLDVFEVNSERESNERNYDSTDHWKQAEINMNAGNVR